MLWASDALGRDGKPAVLLLATTRTQASLTVEAAYVARDLPPGPLPGTFYRSRDDHEPVTVVWPEGWPPVTTHNKLHPRQGTPEAVVRVVDGATRIRLSLLREAAGA